MEIHPSELLWYWRTKFFRGNYLKTKRRTLLIENHASKPREFWNKVKITWNYVIVYKFLSIPLNIKSSYRRTNSNVYRQGITIELSHPQSFWNTTNVFLYFGGSKNITCFPDLLSILVQGLCQETDFIHLTLKNLELIGLG